MDHLAREHGAHASTVPGVAHLEALLDEITPQHVPDAGLVIDDQDMRRVSHPRAGIEPYPGEKRACSFARHPNRVLNRDQLIDLVKGREWAAYDRGVDTQVMRLRKKIETDPSNPSLIKTVRGSGYVFAAAVTVD